MQLNIGVVQVDTVPINLLLSDLKKVKHLTSNTCGTLEASGTKEINKWIGF